MRNVPLQVPYRMSYGEDPCFKKVFEWYRCLNLPQEEGLRCGLSPAWASGGPGWVCGRKP